MHRLTLLEAGAKCTFTEFFESSNVGLAILDRRLRYRMVNQYLATAHGVPIKAHIGRHVREILGPLTAQVEPALQHVLATKEAVCGLELVGNLPGSSTTWRWIVNYFPIVTSAGNIKELGAVVLEVPKHVRPLVSQRTISGKVVIRSWKEIAEYVGACVKTVQRWERTLGFPARRINRNKGATVFALTSEIDEWLNKTSRFA